MRYILSVLALVVLFGTVGCQPKYHNRYDRYDKDRYDRYDRYDRDRCNDRYDRDRYEYERYRYEMDRYEMDRYDDPYRQFDSNDVSRQQLLRHHNEIRGKYKYACTDLQINTNLERAAQRHAEWMAYHKKLSHVGENESRVKDRVSGNWRYLGENIAYGYRDETEAIQAWTNSDDHYQNIIKREHKYAGFGVAKARDGTLYWCVVFGG